MQTTGQYPQGSSHPNPAGAQLARMGELDDFRVARGEPDIRGWTVRTADGREAGKVDDLIVDTQAMKVRYMDVELDRKALQLNGDRHVLLPVSEARLDDDKDEVLLGSMNVGQIATLQPYTRGQPITTSGPLPSDQDMRQFYGRRGGSGDVQRLTLAEEELRIGKRMTEAGEVDIRKTVETEHVSKTVPVMHEEVDIERRKVSPDTPLTGRLGEQEVRVPLRAEEAVIEKRVVPTEEVVIRKTQVQGEQKVEADLHKERVDIDRSRTGKKTRH